MDINSLLAREQRALLLARFASCGRHQDLHLADAAMSADRLRASTYPHRAVAFETAA